MGGAGSGTWLRQGRKRLTRESVSVNIDTFLKEEQLKQTVKVEYTPCYFGGKRPWLVCPGENCGRRVKRLYRWNKAWLCRKCHGLAYASQLQSKRCRLLSKVKHLRLQLGEENKNAFSPLSKPPQMSQERYDRLVAQIIEHEISILAGMHSMRWRDFNKRTGGGNANEKHP